MSVEDQFFTADKGVIWLQPDGPNTIMQYLGCHDLGDLTEPRGDVTLTRCRDLSGPRKWRNSITAQGPPDLATFSITALVAATADYLETIDCPTPVYVHENDCGRFDIPLSYQRGWLFTWGHITQKGASNLAMRESVDPSEMSFEFSSPPPVFRYFPLVLTRQVTTEAEALYDIIFCNTPRCLGACGPALDGCEEGFTVAAAGAAAIANVIATADGGTTWTATAADPFIADEDIISNTCFYIDADTVRWVVARGTTDLANPAEIAWSIDGGATWNTVNVGSTNGEFMQWTGALFSHDQRHIWTVTNLGNIYFSSDGAISWTEQTTTNTNALNYIRFVDFNYGLAVGDTNTILFTSDGGEHWTTITGPAAKAADDALCCEILDANRWWVGYDDGTLYYTNDGGANWSERTVDTPTGHVSTDRINDIHFFNDFFGAFVTQWTDGDTNTRASIHRTFNGGQDWEVYAVADAFDTDSPTGLNSVWMCNPNLIYAVGHPIDSTAAIYTASPAGEIPAYT